MARPTNEQRVIIAQRRARVLAMRVEQLPYSEIAAREGIAESTAKSDYMRARKQAAADLAGTAAQHREAELINLAALEREAWKVLRARHIVVQQGKVAGRYTGRFLRGEDGEIIRDRNDKPVYEVEEIEDDAPVLAAIDRLERLSKRRAALLGLDAPVKLEVSAEVDAEITAVAAALAAGVGDMEPGGETQAPGDPQGG